MTPYVKLIVLILVVYAPFRMGLAPWLDRMGVTEKVAVSVTGSFIVLFLGGLAGFYTGAPPLLVHALIPALLLVAGLARALRRGDGAIAGFTRQEAAVLLIFTLAAGWVLLLQANVVNYGGGGWTGDWYEHYERALFFRGDVPLDHKFSGLYELTARPPFFNLVAYVLMSFIGTSFADYQICATLMGVAIVLPCALLLGRILPASGPTAGEHGPRTVAIVSSLLLLHPMIVTHLVYPWTRMLTNVLLLMGLHLYMSALSGTRHALPGAFLFFAAAHLTHYSADSVILCVCLHMVWTAAGRGSAIRGELPGAVAASFLLLGSWYLWSLARFGIGGTFATNTTWLNIVNRPSWLLWQIAYNVKTTFVPFIEEIEARLVKPMDPTLWLYELADRLHLFWTGTLVGAISTSLLAALLAVLLAGWLRGRRPDVMSPDGPARQTGFVVLLAAGSLVPAFPTTPNTEPSGIVHLALQPACILAFLAGLACLQRGPRWGVGLFIILQTAEASLFYVLKTLPRVIPSPERQSALYTHVWYENMRLKLVTHQLRFLSDEFPSLAAMSRYALLTLVPVLAWCAWRLLARARADQAGASPQPR